MYILCIPHSNATSRNVHKMSLATLGLLNMYDSIVHMSVPLKIESESRSVLICQAEA